MARVNVLLEFNGASAEGNYKCDTSLTPISDLFRYTASPNIAKVGNVYYDQIKLYLTCQEDEHCFDVSDKVYWEDDHWNEPDGSCSIGMPWY
jgi:hypothetical protein